MAKINTLYILQHYLIKFSSASDLALLIDILSLLLLLLILFAIIIIIIINDIIVIIICYYYCN